MSLIGRLQSDQDLQGARPDTDKLRGLYQQYSDKPGFISQLISAISQAQTEITSSWLFKHHLQQQQVLDTDQTADLLMQLQRFESWQARLQVLQCIQFLTIPAGCKQKVEQYARENLTDNNTFVRAWAYDAFFRVALQFPEYRQEAQQLLEMGLRDEPASVKARIRRLMAGPV